MRHNDARKWLHAGLDLLPLILIPIFMIYSHRHDLSTDITISQDVYKNFYQGVKNGKPISLNNITIEDGDVEVVNDKLKIDFAENDNFDISFQTQFNQNNNDIYYLQFNIDATNELIEEINVDFGSISTILNNVTGLNTYSIYDTMIDTFSVVNIYGGITTSKYCYLYNVEAFNLTQIFGVGNEPTKEVFESYLTQDYYDFGDNQVKVGSIDVPAKNNDIMSVFMDSFNNSVNKYFNMGNVFNMTSVYNWFNTNIFNGTAPVVIYSVWNIVLYEFVMDLLFLLYGLFMWFIDMCKHLMEKPFRSIK